MIYWDLKLILLKAIWYPWTSSVAHMSELGEWFSYTFLFPSRSTKWAIEIFGILKYFTEPIKGYFRLLSTLSKWTSSELAELWSYSFLSVLSRSLMSARTSTRIDAQRCFCRNLKNKPIFDPTSIKKTHNYNNTKYTIRNEKVSIEAYLI